jgi:hypothetical protein
LYSVICGILSTYYAALYRLLEFSGSREKERGNDLVDGVNLAPLRSAIGMMESWVLEYWSGGFRVSKRI